MAGLFSKRDENRMIIVSVTGVAGVVGYPAEILLRNLMSVSNEKKKHFWREREIGFRRYSE
jgi:hypothetical protein